MYNKKTNQPTEPVQPTPPQPNPAQLEQKPSLTKEKTNFDKLKPRVNQNQPMMTKKPKPNPVTTTTLMEIINQKKKLKPKPKPTPPHSKPKPKPAEKDVGLEPDKNQLRIQLFLSKKKSELGDMIAADIFHATQAGTSAGQADTIFSGESSENN